MFKGHPDITGAHLVSWRGETIAVTFDPNVFDRLPNSVHLLSYGNSLLDDLLGSVGDPPGSDDPNGVGLLRTRDATPLSLFVRPDSEGARVVRTLDDLRTSMSESTEHWSESAVAAAGAMFQAAWGDAARRHEVVAEDRRKREALALIEEARLVLVRTALLELAEAQRPELFTAALPYGFGVEAVLALKRHGVPYRGLLGITGTEALSAEPTDPYFLAVQGQPVEWLRRTREALKQQGGDLLGRFAAFRDARAQASAMPALPTAVERRWFPVPAGVPEQARPNVVLLDRHLNGRAFRVLAPEEMRPFETACRSTISPSRSGGSAASSRWTMSRTSGSH